MHYLHKQAIINLKTKLTEEGIVMKTSFKTQVLRMGLGSFVDIKWRAKFEIWDSTYATLIGRIINLSWKQS